MSRPIGVVQWSMNGERVYKIPATELGHPAVRQIRQNGRLMAVYFAPSGTKIAEQWIGGKTAA